MKMLLTVFVTVFLAELGDKTQLATLLFASSGEAPKWAVFLAASAALVAATGVAVLAASAAEKLLTAVPLPLLAGLGFIVIGALMVLEHFRSA
jgi:putative Ca2+/H+ antiporter (TMEM165/GDT1 family)